LAAHAFILFFSLRYIPAIGSSRFSMQTLLRRRGRIREAVFGATVEKGNEM
jgi:hypothetical protein